MSNVTLFAYTESSIEINTQIRENGVIPASLSAELMTLPTSKVGLWRGLETQYLLQDAVEEDEGIYQWSPKGLVSTSSELEVGLEFSSARGPYGALQDSSLEYSLVYILDSGYTLAESEFSNEKEVILFFKEYYLVDMGVYLGRRMWVALPLYGNYPLPNEVFESMVKPYLIY